MDVLTKRLEGLTGVFMSDAEGSSSDLFILISILSRGTILKKRSILVISKTTENNLRLICGKLAIRWDPSLIKCLEVSSILGNDLRPNVNNVFDAILEEVERFNAQQVLFDELNCLERLGFSALDTVNLVSDLLNVVNIEGNGIVFAAFSERSRSYHTLVCRAIVLFHIEHVGAGYGKDVTGTLSISIRNTGLISEKTDLLYLLGDRTMKCFYPGNAAVYF